MGFARRADLAGQLLGVGWDRLTPSAIVADGTLPQAQVWRGTLGELAEGGAQVASTGPALIVIGQVAALDLRTTINAERVEELDTASTLRARRSR